MQFSVAIVCNERVMHLVVLRPQNIRFLDSQCVARSFYTQLSQPLCFKVYILCEDRSFDELYMSLFACQLTSTWSG